MAEPAGLLLLDKPRGPTSHDVVGSVRRALGTREVGHGGTLDPMATGLLVVLVGAATRLEPFVSRGDKTYETVVRLGVGTDTLDADGVVVSRAAPPPDVATRLAAALDGERARKAQVPPAVSAIHVDGRRAHERVRAGEVVVLAPREVEVRSLACDGVTEGDGWTDVALRVTSTKGYYVRALARDLGEALGVPAHLASLRRVASGGLSVAQATTLDGDLRRALVPLPLAVASLMPTRSLTLEGAARARQGKTLSRDDFLDEPDTDVEGWLLGEEVVAIGRAEGDGFRVVRGFPHVARAAAG